MKAVRRQVDQLHYLQRGMVTDAHWGPVLFKWVTLHYLPALLAPKRPTTTLAGAAILN